MIDGRRILQVAVSLGACVPLVAGATGVVLGPGMIDHEGIATLPMDSHYRYLSGLLMGIGLAFWTTVPAIEKKTARFQLLSAIVILGGLGRLFSALAVGIPDKPMLFGLAMELIVVPLLAVMQSVIASNHRVLK